MDSQLIDMIKSTYIQNSMYVRNHKKPKKKVFVIRSWDDDNFILYGFDKQINLKEFFSYPKRDVLFYFSPEIIYDLLDYTSELETSITELEDKLEDDY